MEGSIVFEWILLDLVSACCQHNITLAKGITTAADDKFCEIFSNFRKKKVMIADNSHEMSCLISYF